MSDAAEPGPAPQRAKLLQEKKLKQLAADHARSGVVYLSRLPPFMKPAKLRHLLQQHGDVLRLYLAAEGAPKHAPMRALTRPASPLSPAAPPDPTARLKRKKAGGNSGKRFKEG
jgi:ESF2/ABP1 family protein